MATLGDGRLIIPCREFEPAEIALDQLIDGAAFRIYPGVDKYFDIDYRGGRLVVAPKSYVGYIPLNDSIALRVLPRFPLGNLFYILRRASAKLNFVEGYLREYGLLDERDQDPLRSLVVRFVDLLSSIRQNGLLCRYVEERESDPFRGTLNVAETVIRYRSRGINYAQTWSEEELTTDTPENALLLSALKRAVAYFAQDRSRDGSRHLSTLKSIEPLFDGVVQSGRASTEDEYEVHKLIGLVPAHRRDYVPLLWLAFLLHSGRGVSVESTGGLEMDTFVVNLAEVFEDYVRTILTEAFELPRARQCVRNGNTNTVRLFRDSDAHVVKPDTYVLSEGRCVLVLDAKYKLAVKPADRYEVLAFCEALQCKRAILITPRSEGNTLIPLGTTAGGIGMWRLQIDLACPDIQAEEAKITRQIKDLVPDLRAHQF